MLILPKNGCFGNFQLLNVAQIKKFQKYDPPKSVVSEAKYGLGLKKKIQKLPICHIAVELYYCSQFLEFLLLHTNTSEGFSYLGVMLFDDWNLCVLALTSI